MNGPVLIKQQLLGGRAVTVTDVDNPAAGVLAVAMRSGDGWSVAKGSGEVVGERLPQKRATWLLTRTAREVATRAKVRALLAAQPREAVAW
ncbi:hypothetical protein RB614_13345 [Phytohabitans sp. ZYX-F-186]|uniref:Uncharacterized protein n=1 Tax=Phytohabitans maris TaxID=3071409 RepID=A0ABU0ZEM6_9ACTN|nr:hypothetical protein [Phytohabitans sp. ZYX-F-186]MDQ7905509.1 hypothetical protein [Phytohabitans sp. ZYX-F-186]